MKKKIFIITGMILCILAGIVIVPSVIRTRQAVKEFEKSIPEGFGNAVYGVNYYAA